MSESMGGPITHWDGCWRDRWHWACAQTQIMELTAKLEAMERYESSLASLADCINQELRECGQFSMQIEDYLGDDMRPFIRRLVDANRKRAAAQEETK